jgi:hypothetical protein
VPFELPPSEERRERLGGVLGVLYVIFTEGSTATTGDRLLRPDLAYEAIRLARMLAALLPDEPEVYGLLALFELTAVRFPARTGPDGEAVLLEDQDRRLWDRSAIRRGLAAIGRASAVERGLGRTAGSGRDPQADADLNGLARRRLRCTGGDRILRAINRVSVSPSAHYPCARSAATTARPAADQCADSDKASADNGSGSASGRRAANSVGP